MPCIRFRNELPIPRVPISALLPLEVLHNASGYSLLHGYVDREQVAIKVPKVTAKSTPDLVRLVTSKDIATLWALQTKHIRIMPVRALVEGRGWLVMPYYKRTLATYLTKGNGASDDDWLRIAADVIGAIAVIHREGYAHLDLKPTNIMLDDEGHAYVTDLGSASRLPGNNTPAPATVPAYTPHYVTGDFTETKEQRDVFGLCKTLLEIRMGRFLQVVDGIVVGIPDDDKCPFPSKWYSVWYRLLKGVGPKDQRPTPLDLLRAVHKLLPTSEENRSLLEQCDRDDGKGVEDGGLGVEHGFDPM
jgi:serine/threonine protein kinase